MGANLSSNKSRKSSASPVKGDGKNASDSQPSGERPERGAASKCSSEGPSRSKRVSQPKPEKYEPVEQSTAQATPPRLKKVESDKEKNSRSGSSDAQLASFFMTYADKESGIIGPEGVEQLCKDLKVEPTDLAVLAFAWKCEVKEACAFSREEFFRGCRTLKADNLKSLKGALPSLVAGLGDKKAFTKLYSFTFDFGLEQNETRMPAEMAVSYWELLFSREPPSFLGKWYEFCLSSPGLMISRDVWSMFLQFIRQTKPDFSNYDEDAAWPNLIDDFVESQL